MKQKILKLIKILNKFTIDDILSIVLSSFLLSSIAAIILMTVFKKKKNFEMAFSPFLLIGYGLVKGVYFICG